MIRATTAVLGILALAATAASGLKMPASPDGYKVGVVNLRQCFDEANYEYAKDVTDELKKLKSAIEAELSDIDRKMKDLKDQMEGIKDRSSALFQDKLRQYKVQETNLKVSSELKRVQLIGQYSERKMEVFNEIVRCIEIYGRDAKFDWIMRVDEPQLEDDSPESISQRINHRVVLFHNNALDVTKDVLALLKLEYAKKKAAVAPKEPVPGQCPKCGIGTQDVKCPKCGADIPKAGR